MKVMSYKTKLFNSLITLGTFMVLVSVFTLPTFASGSLDVPTTGSVTQPFLSTNVPDQTGSYYDKNDQLQNSGSTSFHNGVDVQQTYGSDCAQNVSPVYAAAAGTVIFAGYDTSGYGYTVEIDHGNSISSNGKYVFTLYGHMGSADVNNQPGASCIVVSANQTVTKGQLLGYQGESGHVTGVHLHWGTFANPSVDSFSDSNTVVASPDFYSCVPLTVALNTNPSPTANVITGQNFCWTANSPSDTNVTYLYGMSASGTSAWAVGNYLPSGVYSKRPIAYLNNGSGWTKYTPTYLGSSITHYLYGVAGSASNAWAVGSATLSPTKTLAYHWTGSSWGSPVTSDNGTSTYGNELDGVAIDGSGGVWAVGWYGMGTYSLPLLEKWNGTKFALQTIYLPSGYTTGKLHAVSFSSSTNGWAVGEGANSSIQTALVYRWDGSNWTSSTPSNPSGYNNVFWNSIAAVSDSEAWAVGSKTMSGSNITPTISHYTSANGWQEDTSFSFQNTAIYAVSGDSPSDVWVVGEYGSNHAPFAMHYDGSSWQQVSTPSLSGRSPLQGVAVNAGHAWAGGFTGSAPYPLTLKSL